MIGDSLGYAYDKVIGYKEGIKMGSTDDKVIDAILGNVNRIIPGIDIVT